MTQVQTLEWYKSLASARYCCRYPHSFTLLHVRSWQPIRPLTCIHSRWGWCEEYVSSPSEKGPGKNHTFVGSYKLPLCQYMCIDIVVACCFQYHSPAAHVILEVSKRTFGRGW
jgi:hypothetical protein